MIHVRRVVNYVRGLFGGAQGGPAPGPAPRRRMTADRVIVSQGRLVLPDFPQNQLPVGVTRRSTRVRKQVVKYQAGGV